MLLHNSLICGIVPLHKFEGFKFFNIGGVPTLGMRLCACGKMALKNSKILEDNALNIPC